MLCIASQGTSSKVTDGNKKMPTMSGGDITDGDFSSKDALKDKSKVIGMLYVST